MAGRAAIIAGTLLAASLLTGGPVLAEKGYDAGWILSQSCEDLLAQGRLDCGEMARRTVAENLVLTATERRPLYGCFMTLLRHRRYAEFIDAWRSFTPGDDELRGRILHSLGMLAEIHTDGKCDDGLADYDDDGLFSAVFALIENYDAELDRARVAGRRAKGYPSLLIMPPVFYEFIESLRYFLRHRHCGKRANYVKALNMFLDRGVAFDFLDEDYNRTPASPSLYMALRDAALLERILESAPAINRVGWRLLVGRAPTMEMVRLLERHGYVLTRDEYRAVAAGIRKRDRDYDPLTEREPAVLLHFEKMAK